jgi:hypothetical protein
MISQEIRKIAPEMDPLRRGMGWSLLGSLFRY